MDVWYSTWKKKPIFLSKNCSCWEKTCLLRKKAKEKQAEYHGNQYDKKSGITPNLVEVQNNRTDNETNSKLAKLAGVGKETYRMGAKILNSDNEELKKRVQSGETSISAGYKELSQNREEKRPYWN